MDHLTTYNHRQYCYLRAYKALYNCRFPTTNVMSALQISPFMQNKANFGKAQMNVNKVITEDYENIRLSRSGKNKANSKPNKANLLNAQINVNKVLTKDYENISNCKLCENKANTKPNKANLLNAQMNVNKVLTKDYENKRLGRLRENKANTNPIYRVVASGEDGYKPKQSQFQRFEMYKKPHVKSRIKTLRRAWG